MSLSHHALYNCLVEDLSVHLPDLADREASSIVPWADMTFEQFASLALAKSLLKKFKDGFSAGPANQAALDKFLLTNSSCKNWSMDFCNTSADEELVGTFKHRIYDFYYRGGALLDEYCSAFDAGRTGPGASLGARGNDFYTKMFSSPLTYTSSGLRDNFDYCVSQYEPWAAAESLRSSKFGSLDSIVPGNKLSFVPKNVDTSRVICVEPSLNMFLQLGIGTRISDRLRSYFGIDLSTQPDINRDMAQIGSRLDNLCTIDLESASDSVSYRMVRELFPKMFFSWLDFARSPMASHEGENHELHMLSSMGNGFTFPLQTLIFCCVVSAVYSSMGLKMDKTRGEHLGNFGVFGDDIIVVKEAYPRVVRLLALLGFKVNADKSFFEGPFRESCGGDFFLGRSCRGVYIKTLRSQPSRCVAVNRLNDWSARVGISLPRTISYLMKRTRFLPVPLYENDDAGIKVPFRMIEGLRRDKDVQSVLYRRHVPIAHNLRLCDGAIKQPRGAKSRFYNPHGLLLAFLRGDIVSKGGPKGQATLGIRLGPARYKTKLAIAPSWDWLPTARRGLLVDESRLISAITANMC